MRPLTWLRQRLNAEREARRGRPGMRNLCSRPAPRFRPCLEALEDRCLLSAGVLDPTFGSGGIVTNNFGPATEWQGAAAVAIYPNGGTANDGKIVAAGNVPINKTNTNYIEGFAVARYGPNGTLDSSFGAGGEVTTQIGSGNARANDVAIQTDGKVVAAGYASNSSGNLEFAVARYNLNGSLDTTFGSGKSAGIVQTNMSRGSSDSAQAMALQADGKIVVAGLSSSQFALVRYNTNGSLDTTFNGSGKVVTNFSSSSYGYAFNSADVAIYPTSSSANAGKIVVVGLLQNANGTYSVAVLRYNPNGSPDSTFGGGTGYVLLNTPGVGRDSFPHVAIQADDRLDVAFTADGLPTWEMSVVRLQANGSLDTSFGVGGIATTNHQMSDTAESLALQTNGQIVVAGTEGVLPNETFVMARFNANGSLDTAFGTNGFQTAAVTVRDHYGVDVAIQPDGKIVTAGTQEVASGNSSNTFAFALARFLPSDPEIGSFTANPNPVTSGSDVALTASNITDGNPDTTITQVVFYYFDSSGTKQVLGYGTQTSPGEWTFTFAIDLTPGTYTLFSQAEDGYGVFGDPTAFTLTVE